nr:transporter substrate-binding domain-containing protein [Thiospirillum jenense]
MLALWLGVTAVVHAQQVAATPPSAVKTTLRVGVSLTPASGVVSEAGILRGLEIDLAQALSGALGMELVLSVLPERDRVEALRGGRVDTLLSTRPLAELHALRLAASQPVLESGQMAVVRREQTAHFTRPLDVFITRTRVGFVRDADAARVVHQQFPNAQRIPFAVLKEAIAALRDAQIDVLIVDAPTAWRITADPNEQQLIGVMELLATEQLVWVVRETDEALLVGIDAVIKQWSTDGTLRRLIARWLPAQVQVQ